MPSPVDNRNRGAINTGASAPIRATLSGMPVEIMHLFNSFDPDSPLILRVVSRALHQAVQECLQSSMEEIAGLCSREQSPLYGRISCHLTCLRSRLRFQPDRIALQFHLLIPGTIRSLGIGEQSVRACNCPNRILLASEISRFNESIQNGRGNDLTLNAQETSRWRGIWPRLREAIAAANRLPRDTPRADAPPQRMRPWMFANHTRLQRVHELWLGSLRLTSVPVEIGLFTNLQSLFLSHNRLEPIPEELFQGLTSLKRLYLDGNLLDSLPEGLFRGLNQLEALHLVSNRLDSLPAGLFRGLNRLQKLILYYNRLDTLPEDLFQGLTRLRILSLHDNRLRSLPEGLFQGLIQLRSLSLYNNQLRSLPERLFQGLPALRDLRLENNQLGSLPGAVFQELARARSLRLVVIPINP